MPASPASTCSWVSPCRCGWYQSVAAGWSIVHSGCQVAPAAIGWCGPPSIAAGRCIPCQWTVVAVIQPVRDVDAHPLAARGDERRAEVGAVVAEGRRRALRHERRAAASRRRARRPGRRPPRAKARAAGCAAARRSRRSGGGRGAPVRTAWRTRRAARAGATTGIGDERCESPRRRRRRGGDRRGAAAVGARDVKACLQPRDAGRSGIRPPAGSNGGCPPSRRGRLTPVREAAGEDRRRHRHAAELGSRAPPAGRARTARGRPARPARCVRPRPSRRAWRPRGRSPHPTPCCGCHGARPSRVRKTAAAIAAHGSSGDTGASEPNSRFAPESASERSG